MIYDMQIREAFRILNKLSTDCVNASSVNMFINKVDTYIGRTGYT